MVGAAMAGQEGGARKARGRSGGQREAVAVAAPKTKGNVSVSSFASGVVGGVLSGIFTQPMDVIRTRMQGDLVKTGRHQSMWVAARAVVAERGKRGLWMGTQPSLIRLGLGLGFHMMFIEVLRRRFGEQQAGGGWKLSPVSALVTGAVSRTAATVLLSPVGVVKTRMEYYQTRHFLGNTFQALTAISRREGFRGLYKGIWETVASTAPFSALYYSLYIAMQERMPLGEEREKVFTYRVARNLAASTGASVIATVVTQPFDVLRTQAQLDTSLAGASLAGSVAGAVRLTKEMGVQSLFVGSAPRFLKRTMQAIIVWTVYEELFRLAQASARMQERRKQE